MYGYDVVVAGDYLLMHCSLVLVICVCFQFVTVECFITSVSDLFPKRFRKPGRSEIFVLLICIASYLIQLLLVSEVR